ncbi:MAG: zinc ribbon domain-containing protein [Clostridium sp.]|nr:zinc ribbon domain-containing protein [Clostridium sp.]MCM1460096.1 zinc ribbon domain-containing protein [Bacteroides sp.]
MQCSNCGKEIKDGMDYCMECGAPIEEPAVLSKETIKASQKKAPQMIEEQGSFFDLSGYVDKLKSSITILLAFIGALLLYFSSFSSWIWSRLFDDKTSANLFDLGSKSQELYLGSSKFLILGILTFAAGLLMLIMSASTFIRPLKKISTNKLLALILKLLPVIISIIVLILILKDNAYSTAYNNIKSQIELAKSLGASSNFDGGRGLGPILYIAGTCIYAVSVLIDILENRE